MLFFNDDGGRSVDPHSMSTAEAPVSEGVDHSMMIISRMWGDRSELRLFRRPLMPNLGVPSVSSCGLREAAGAFPG